MTLELARPGALWLLALIPLWLWYVRPRATWGLLVARGDAARGAALRRWAGAAIEAGPRMLRGLAAAAVIGALARPQLVRTYAEPVTEGVGIAIAIDLSTSMWALDMSEAPGDPATRLEAAKETVQRFLVARDEDDDVGLVTFAGEALVRLPLTRDRYVAEAAVSALEVGLLLDGTDIAGAIAVGAGLLKDAPQSSKMLILVTDGAHNRAGLVPGVAARAAAAFGVRIFPIAIGSEEALRRAGSGMETVLVQAARITGGRYFRATDISSLDQIYAEIDRLAVPAEGLVERRDVTPVGHWLLVAALALLVIALGLRASPLGVVP
ncbi:MAG: VWA domain-containing protein [Gemmatimonadales bacterium]